MSRDTSSAGLRQFALECEQGERFHAPSRAAFDRRTHGLDAGAMAEVAWQ